MDDQFNYDALDAGIRETVRFLVERGFETTDSGDGVSKFQLHDYEAADEVIDMPHVVMVCEPPALIETSERLAHEMRELGLTVRVNDAHDAEAFSDVVAPDDAISVEISASYDPANKIAVIVLSWLDDAKLLRARSGALVS